MSETTEEHGLDAADDPLMRQWMEDWQAEPGEEPVDGGRIDSIANVRRRARRWSVWMWICSVLDVLSVAGLVMLAVHIVRTEPSLKQWVFGIMIIILAMVALASSWWNRRGTWRPANDSTLAYVELEILRTRRKIITSSRLLPGFIAFEGVLFVPWMFWARAAEPLRAVKGTLWFIFVAASAIWIASLFTRRFRRQLADLENLWADLVDSSPP